MSNNNINPGGNMSGGSQLMILVCYVENRGNVAEDGILWRMYGVAEP
jgi:hypothetical protein